MSTLGPGKVLAGRFELLRPLGAGGLAEVWVARDLTTDAEVAVKALHEHLVKDAGLAERFRRELAVTRGLAHPGIVRVFDLYEHVEEGMLARPIFAMELLKGKTLAEQLKAGALPAGAARRVARAIAEALQVAHHQGVVHRDLKPQNIFLCDDGKVKLLDFGLARAAGWSRLTAQSTLMGTPGYIAPEILMGKTADARADLYSLGAVLFEMLTGRRAFPVADAYAALRDKGAPPPSPRALAPLVTEADDALVRRALEPDPEKRFLDAGQIVGELDGQKAAAPQPASIALTAGGFDVVVQHSWKQPGKALKKVAARLGLRRTGLGWRIRLAFSGSNALVSGASRESAEAVATACRDEGLAVAVVESKPISKARALLAPHTEGLGGLAGLLFWAKLTASVAPNFHVGSSIGTRTSAYDYLFAALATSLPAAIGAFFAWLAFAPLELPPAASGLPVQRRLIRSQWLQRHSERLALIGPVAFVAGLFGTMSVLPALGVHLSFLANVIIFATLGLGAFAGIAVWQRKAIVDLPTGDGAIRRLQQGIAERVQRLRERTAAARPASQMVLEGILMAANQAQRTAALLADEAAVATDGFGKPQGDSRPGEEAPAKRDAAVDRLLRVAASLDAVLAAQEGAHADAALADLRHELSGPPDAPRSPPPVRVAQQVTPSR